MVFVCVSIRTASKILKPWYARTVLDGKQTLSDVFAEFASGEFDGGVALYCYKKKEKKTRFLAFFGIWGRETVVFFYLA